MTNECDGMKCSEVKLKNNLKKVEDEAKHIVLIKSSLKESLEATLIF